ncbi:hypothetical protein D3C84_963030 [compost metagenome]
MTVLAVIVELVGELFRNQQLTQAQALIVVVIERTLFVELAVEVDVRRAPGLVAQTHAGAEGFAVTRSTLTAEQYAAINRQRAAGATRLFAERMVPDRHLYVL